MRWRRATMARRARTPSYSNKSQPWRQRRPTCSSICLTCRDVLPSSNSRLATRSTTESECWVRPHACQLPALSHANDYIYSFAEWHDCAYHSPETPSQKIISSMGEAILSIDVWCILLFAAKGVSGVYVQRLVNRSGSLITIKVNKERDRSLIYAIFIHSHKFI